MNTADNWIWGLLWIAFTLLFFALPLWPAWRELRTASDAKPLAIDDADTGLTSYRAQTTAQHLPWLNELPANRRWPYRNTKAVRASEPVRLNAGEKAEVLVSLDEIVLEPGSKITRTVHGRELHNKGTQLPLRASADETLALEPGSRFFRISAMLILVAPIDSDRVQTFMRRTDGIEERPRKRVLHKGNLRIGAGQQVQDDLIVTGDLHLEPGACIHGNVKVHGNATLAAGAQLRGSLFATGSIHCERDNLALGPLCASDHVHLGPNFEGGRIDQACSISGWTVTVESGACICGSITAVTGGKVPA